MSVPASRRYNHRWSIIGFIISLIIMVIQLGFIFSLHGFEYGIVRLILAAVFVALFVSAGHFVDVYVYGTIFHREVSNPIVAGKTFYGSYYWLNGETPIECLGFNPYGQLKFKIPGINNPEIEDDYEVIDAWKAEKYISIAQES